MSQPNSCQIHLLYFLQSRLDRVDTIRSRAQNVKINRRESVKQLENQSIEENQIKTFIISQQTLFRDRLSRSLTTHPDIIVVGSTDGGEDTLTSICDNPPVVLIIDLDGDTEAYLQFAQKFTQQVPSLALVVLDSPPNNDDLVRAIKAQAAAYSGKDISGENLLELVRKVANGQHPIDESITASPGVAE